MMIAVGETFSTILNTVLRATSLSCGRVVVAFGNDLDESEDDDGSDDPNQDQDGEEDGEDGGGDDDDGEDDDCKYLIFIKNLDIIQIFKSIFEF